jgi:hypothetical protein
MKIFAVLFALAPVTAILLFVWFERVSLVDARIERERLEVKAQELEFDMRFDKSLKAGRIVEDDSEANKEKEERLAQVRQKLKESEQAIAAGQERQEANIEALRQAIETSK